MISGEKPITKAASIYLCVGNRGEGEKQDPFFLHHFSLGMYKRAARFSSDKLFKNRGNNVFHRWDLLLFLKVNTIELFSNRNFLCYMFAAWELKPVVLQQKEFTAYPAFNWWVKCIGIYLLLLGLISCNPGASPDLAVPFQVLKGSTWQMHILRLNTDWEIISELLLYLFFPSVISSTIQWMLQLFPLQSEDYTSWIQSWGTGRNCHLQPTVITAAGEKHW